MSVAREHGLTAYGPRIKLAARRGLPLATGERNLEAAADRVGVVLIGETR
jgi:hypothetical protein